MTLFNGDMSVYSTCRDCGTAMVVTQDDQYVHPTCTYKAGEAEKLSQVLARAIEAGNDTLTEITLKQLDGLETVIDLPGAAREYASQGWPCFPLGRHAKEPAIPKRKGGKGFKDANADVARIEKWWKRHPDHNIGVATGHAFDVIDIDPRHGGIQSFLKLLAAKRIPEVHGIVITARGGMHLYVKPTGKGNFAGKHHENDPPSEDFKPAPIRLPEGIDYRGLGGYVVAPPSTLGERWRSYAWLTVPSPKLKGGQ